MKKTRLPKIMAYVFSALLFVSYTVILSSAADPDVCQEYEQYYITKELEDWPGYGGLAYQSGTPVCFFSDAPKELQVKRRGKGWGLKEEEGCWTYGDEAVLFFTELSGKDMEMEIELTDMEKNTVTEIYANSEKAGELDKPETSSVFPVSGKWVRDGKLKISFRTIREKAPEHTPALGIKVREITLHEKD